MCSTGSRRRPTRPALRRFIPNKKAVMSLAGEAGGPNAATPPPAPQPFITAMTANWPVFLKDGQRGEWIHQMCGIKQTNGAWESSLWRLTSALQPKVRSLLLDHMTCLVCRSLLRRFSCEEGVKGKWRKRFPDLVYGSWKKYVSESKHSSKSPKALFDRM